MRNGLYKAGLYSILMGLIYGFANHLSYLVNGIHVGFGQVVFVYVKCVLVVIGTVLCLLGIAYLLGKMHK